jgi:hypothetical protein
MGLYLRNEADQSIDDAAEVDAHDPVVIGVGGLVRGTEHADAGVVHQHVNLAKTLLHVFRRRRESRPVSDIERYEDRWFISLLHKPLPRLIAVCRITVT